MQSTVVSTVRPLVSRRFRLHPRVASIAPTLGEGLSIPEQNRVRRRLTVYTRTDRCAPSGSKPASSETADSFCEASLRICRLEPGHLPCEVV